MANVLTFDTTDVVDQSDLNGAFDQFAPALTTYEKSQSFYKIKNLVAQIVSDQLIARYDTPLYVDVVLDDDELVLTVNTTGP